MEGYTMVPWSLLFLMLAQENADRKKMNLVLEILTMNCLGGILPAAR
jgi:hypothetical protein